MSGLEWRIAAAARVVNFRQRRDGWSSPGHLLCSSGCVVVVIRSDLCALVFVVSTLGDNNIWLQHSMYFPPPSYSTKLLASVCSLASSQAGYQPSVFSPLLLTFQITCLHMMNVLCRIEHLIWLGLLVSKGEYFNILAFFEATWNQASGIITHVFLKLYSVMTFYPA